MKQEVKSMYEALNQKPEGEMLPLLRALGASKMSFSDKDTSIQFSVKGDKKTGINRVVVKLDYGRDLYNVEFWDCRILRKDPFIIQDMKDEIQGLDFENLVDAIWRKVVIV